MGILDTMLLRRKYKHEQEQHVFVEMERPFSVEERTLLEFVLTNTTPQALLFVDQLDETIVTGCCTRCPTAVLRGPDREGELLLGSGPVVDLFGRTPDGRLIGFQVHATRRQLSGIEVYDLSGTLEPLDLPTLSSLEDRQGKRLMSDDVNA
jgi:hypothetical protein